MPPAAKMLLHGLALAGTGWVPTSAALVTGLAPAALDKPLDFIRGVVLADGPPLFELWLALGAFLAAPVFASSVVAIPLLMERPVSVLATVLTSWRMVRAHPLPMVPWAADGLGHGHAVAGLGGDRTLAGPCLLACLP